MAMISSIRFSLNQPHVVFESFADEVVLINLASGNYYSADRVGKAVIELLAERLSPAEIVSGLAAKYNWNSAEIKPEIDSFTAALQAEGLIVEAVDQDSAAGANAVPAVPPVCDHLDFTAPRLQRYSDMQDLLLLDPIHEVDESGWPVAQPDRHERDE